MISGRYRWLVLAGAVAVVVVLFLVLRGGDNDDEAATTAARATSATTTATTRPTTRPTTTVTDVPTFVNVLYQDGKVVGGPKTYQVPFNDRVIMLVKSDVADEVHVHGYDLMKDVKKNETVKIAFVADLSGRCEFELEDQHLRLGTLVVAPS